MFDNTITLSGNATRDPELRHTASGRPVAVFGLAVNRRYQQNNQWQERTSFFDVVAWGPLGENTAITVHKGDRVVVTGCMEQRSWEDDDGQKRSKLELVATDVGASLRWATAALTQTAKHVGEAPHPADDAEPSEEPF